MLSIYLSSTSRDLEQHRDAVIKALLTADTLPKAMEFFGAQSADPVAASLAPIETCDLFIGIYANRYGHRPAGTQSITEMEYDHAVQQGRERLIFIVDPTYREGLIEQHRETDFDAITALALFKNRLNAESTRATFTTPDNLASQVLAAVLRWYQARQPEPPPPSPGTIISGNDNRIISNSTFGDNATINLGDTYNK